MNPYRLTCASLLCLSALALPALASDTRATVFTSAQASAGKVAYESSCGLCHLSSLRGRTGGPEELPDPDTLAPDYQKTISGNGGYIPPLVGAEFMAKWAPKTAGEFAERILDATKGFPPKDSDAKTFLAVAAYILQVNGASPGAQELTTTTPIRVSATLPKASGTAAAKP
jgi:hypothetical protein